MSLFAVVHPLVLTLEGYQNSFGEDDPEELTLMQLADKELAQVFSEVLDEVFAVKADLTVPREEEGSSFDLGEEEHLQTLKDLAAEASGVPIEDYLEGRMPVGSRFMHLINHAGSGYYLPVDFLQPFFLEEQNRSVGSTQALLADLEALRAAVEVRYPEALQASVDDLDLLDDSPGRVWRVLHLLCQESLDLDLPIELD